MTQPLSPVSPSQLDALDAVLEGITAIDDTHTSGSPLAPPPRSSSSSILPEARQQTCCLCKSRLTTPLLLCAKDHVACASCIVFPLVQTRCVWEKKMAAPIFSFQSVDCPVCKGEVHIRVPDDTVARSWDPKPCTACPWCDQTFAPSFLGMHILNCDKLVTSCSLCLQLVLVKEYWKHMYYECNHLQCPICRRYLPYAQIAQHNQVHKFMEFAYNDICAFVRNKDTFLRYNPLMINHLLAQIRITRQQMQCDLLRAAPDFPDPKRAKILECNHSKPTDTHHTSTVKAHDTKEAH